MAHRHNGVRFRISCFIPDTRYLPSKTAKVVANRLVTIAATKCFPLRIGPSVDLDFDGGLSAIGPPTF